MAAPIALQLYSVREALAEDFVGVMRKVADMGYVGVEPIFKLPGTTIPEAVKLVKELGFPRAPTTRRRQEQSAGLHGRLWLSAYRLWERA